MRAIKSLRQRKYFEAEKVLDKMYQQNLNTSGEEEMLNFL